MKVTRAGVFETNSSSTHSIHIAEGEFDCSTLFVDDNGLCCIYPSEFGWEKEEYNDAPTKASYCLTFAWSHNNPDEHLELLRDVIIKATKAKRVEFVESDSSYFPKGYIDHQSDGVCAPAFATKKSLRAFIFNPASELWTDNDNDY